MKVLGSIARTILVTAVVLVTGFLGLAQVFSDLGPRETGMQRILSTLLTCIIGSLLIGLIVPKRWYLAVLNAWGPLLLAGGGLLVAIRMGRVTEVLSGLLPILVVMPGTSLLSALAGALMRQRLHRRMR